MKIGELARLTGFRPSAIRYYEHIGLAPAPDRVGGQRRYPSDAADRLRLIRLAGEMGFTLAEIKIFLSGLRETTSPGPRWKKLADRKIKEIAADIERATRLQDLLKGLLRCRCPALAVCVQRLSLSPRLRAISGAKTAKLASRRNRATTIA